MADPWAVVGQSPAQQNDQWKVVAQKRIQETAQPIQSGQAPWMESLGNDIGDILGLGTGHGPPKPTGFLPLDTLREYPYQAEAGIRSGLAMAQHGANALSEGKPSGAVGLGVGGIGALTAPISAAFGPISRPVHDWVGNPVEKATGIPADVVTAGAMALPGVVDVPRIGAPRINQSAPPRTQIDSLVGGDRARQQREAVLNSLQQAKRSAYQRGENAGVIIKPDALKSAADAIRADLADEGFHPQDEPLVGRFLDRLDSVASGGENMTQLGLERLRQVLVKATKDFNNPNQARLAGHAIEHIDSMPLADGDVIVPQGVDPLLAVQDFRQGRALAKTQNKADTIDRYLRVAQNQAEKSKTQDFAGSIQNQLTNLLNRIDRKKLKGFSDEEVARLREAANGKGATYKTLQWLGGFSPDNKISVLTEMLLGMGAGTLAAGPFGGAAGALLAGSGAGAKLTSEAIMRSRANALFNTVARGAPPKKITRPLQPPSPGPGGGPQGPGPAGPMVPQGPQPPIMPAAPQLPSPATPLLAVSQSPTALRAAFEAGHGGYEPGAKFDRAFSNKRPEEQWYAVHANGKPVAMVRGEIKGDTFHVNWFGGQEGGTLSPTTLRAIGRQITAQLPANVKSIEGIRTSGARGRIGESPTGSLSLDRLRQSQ